MAPPRFAIYGATGHTGRLVAAELRARGQDMVLAGRNADALKSLAADFDAPAVVAPLDDPGALRALAEDVTVLIHCAGPYSRTGEAVASAAAEAGCHYVDHAVEVHHVRRMFEDLPGVAARTGAVMVPSVSFYGGLGDLLAGAVAADLPDLERIIVGYAVTGWRLTAGAKATATQLFAETERVTFADGVQSVGYVEPRNVVFPFPPPLGPRAMIAPVPFPEAVTVPRHVATRNVEAQLTAHTFTEEGVFEGEDVDLATRAGTDFTVAVQAIPGGAGQLAGRDLWRAGALASVEAALLLARGEGPATGGVYSPAEAFPPRPFLRRLEELDAFTLTLEG
jgi:short subunit dehydrogenase-like uncharacterized protein